MCSATRHAAWVALGLAMLLVSSRGSSAGTVLYVNGAATGANTGQSWADAFVRLQDALETARNSPGVAEIWIAAGIYTPAPPHGETWRAFELVDGVGLYGGFNGTETDRDQRDKWANPTILSGDLNGDDAEDEATRTDNSNNIILGADLTVPCVLDGLTLCRNWPQAGSNIMACGLGLQYADAYLLDCVFTNLVRAVSIENYDSVRVKGCVFGNNQSGALKLRFSWAATAALEDSLFLDNTYGGLVPGRGAGLYADGGAVDLVRCTFDHNACITGNGGGIYLGRSGSLSLRDCRLTGNSAGGYDGRGGAIYSGYPVTLTNCVVSHNEAAGAAGIYVMASLTCINSTIARNHTTFSRYAVSCAPSVSSIQNSILWGNTSKSTSPTIQVSGQVEAANSCIQDWTGGGTGVISADPLFVSSESADGLRLRPGSPCIDAGDNSLLPADVLSDLAGLPRYFDDPDTTDTGAGTPPIVDMGAFEYHPTVPGDLDQTNWVDLNDGLLFIACASGPAMPMMAGCLAADLDGDGDVDQVDFGLFQCLMTSSEPAPPR